MPKTKKSSSIFFGGDEFPSSFLHEEKLEILNKQKQQKNLPTNNANNVNNKKENFFNKKYKGMYFFK